MTMIAILADLERFPLILNKGVRKIEEEKGKRETRRRSPYSQRCLCQEEDEDAMTRSIFSGAKVS
jgi:hypothetical protein